MSKTFIIFFKIRALIFSGLIRFFGFILRVPLPQKISAGAFIEKEGKFLMLDLSYKEGLGVPGGMIDPGENAEKALKREVMEETGLTCVNIKYIGSKEDIQYGYPTLALAFKVEAVGKLEESSEGKLVWKNYEEVINNSAYRNWTELFKEYKKQHESN